MRIDAGIVIIAGGDPAVRRQLDHILAVLKSLQRGNETMTQELDSLTQHVADIETVGDSAIALLEGLKAKLDEAIANNDTAALQELSDRLGMQTQELADAITANTPAEVEPASPVE